MKGFGPTGCWEHSHDAEHICVDSRMKPMRDAWSESYAERKGLAWSPDLWTFVATIKVVEVGA